VIKEGLDVLFKFSTLDEITRPSSLVEREKLGQLGNNFIIIIIIMPYTLCPKSIKCKRNRIIVCILFCKLFQKNKRHQFKIIKPKTMYNIGLQLMSTSTFKLV